MAAHAKLGPSASARWMHCTASVAILDSLAAQGVINPSESSSFADEGTAAHEVRELALNLGLEAYDFIGRTVYVRGVAYPVTYEMADHLQVGIDWIREYVTGVALVETRVDLSAWLPGNFGTLDFGWYCPKKKELGQLDLKYGAGEPVEAEGNSQQLLYALGLWDRLGRPEVEKIIIGIDQPRLGGLKFWEDCTFDMLMEFAAEVEAAYAEIGSGKTKFAPSAKACRWCKARDPIPSKGYMGCPAYNQQQLEVFMGAFDDLDVDPVFPETLTPVQRAYVVTHAPEARKWLAAQHEASLQAAMNGSPDPGLKAVIGQKGNRFFTDETKAESILVGAVGEAAYKPKQLVGIVEAEKLLKPGKKKAGNPDAWEALNALVDQPDGKPILVPTDDPRPAIKPYADQFDDL